MSVLAVGDLLGTDHLDLRAHRNPQRGAVAQSGALGRRHVFILLRRWVAWEPAAFVGGVALGFSPIIVTKPRLLSHLMKSR